MSRYNEPWTIMQLYLRVKVERGHLLRDRNFLSFPTATVISRDYDWNLLLWLTKITLSRKSHWADLLDAKITEWIFFLFSIHRCLWGEIEPFSATLAQDGLAEFDQPGKNPLKYSAVAGNWTRATGRTDSELFHWAIMTCATGRTDSELSHWAIMTRATGRTDSELSHWAIMTRATGRTDSELSHWAIMTDLFSEFRPQSPSIYFIYRMWCNVKQHNYMLWVFIFHTLLYSGDNDVNVVTRY